MAFTDRLHNRGSISTGYDIDNSIKTQANAGNEWFYRASPTAGNKKKFTLSFWIKRSQLDGYQADNYLMSQGSNARFHFAAHSLRFMFDGGSTELESSIRLRDCSAWYHIVIAVDTTQATAANRVKAYLNGQTYHWNNTKYPSQNQESSWMSGTNMYFNTRDGDGSYDNSGYWAEVAVIDGTQYAASDFGEFDEDSNIWKPKDFSEDVTFGSEGFYYKFDDSSSLGADSSGNGNNATLNNITSADQATDTPTNNFCTLNVNNKASSTSITDGATNCDRTDNSNNTVRGTYHLMSGKWYFEVAIYRGTINANYPFVGWTGNNNLDPGPWVHQENKTWSISAAGTVVDVSTYRGAATAAQQDPNYSIYGIAFDIDNKTFLSHTNGTYNNSGNTYSVTISTTQAIVTEEVPMTPFLFMFTGADQSFNFGGYSVITPSSPESDANGYGTFEYPVPSGYYAICSKNVAQYG